MRLIVLVLVVAPSFSNRADHAAATARFVSRLFAANDWTASTTLMMAALHARLVALISHLLKCCVCCVCHVRAVYAVCALGVTGWFVCAPDALTQRGCVPN